MKPVDVRVVSMHCPECAAALIGGETSRLFYCPTCRSLREWPLGPRARSWPVEFAAPAVRREEPVRPLPFWVLDVACRLTTTDTRKESDLRTVEAAVARDVPRVFVCAFAVRNRIYFGDPGEVYTGKQPTWEQGDGAAAVPGAAIDPEVAERIAWYRTLAHVDRRVDVTGVELAMRTTRVRVLAVPFYVGDDSLIDGLLGQAYSRKLLLDPADVLE